MVYIVRKSFLIHYFSSKINESMNFKSLIFLLVRHTLKLFRCIRCWHTCCLYHNCLFFALFSGASFLTIFPSMDIFCHRFIPGHSQFSTWNLATKFYMFSLHIRAFFSCKLSSYHQKLKLNIIAHATILQWQHKSLSDIFRSLTCVSNFWKYYVLSDNNIFT